MYVVDAELVPSVTVRVCAPAASELTLTSLIPFIDGCVFGVRSRVTWKFPSASVWMHGPLVLHAVFCGAGAVSPLTSSSEATSEVVGLI